MWIPVLASSVPEIGKFIEVRVDNSTGTTMDISWDFLGNSNRFRVYYKEVGSSDGNSSTGYISGRNTVTISGLISAKSYEIFIRAEYLLKSVNSGTITASTSIVNPSPATNVYANNVTDNSFDINWTWGANTNRGRIYHRKVGSSNWITSSYISNTQNTESRVISGLTQGTEYEVKIRSEYAGAGVNSDIVTVETVVLQPTPVTGLYANQITENSAMLHWVSGSNTDRLRVYLSTDNISFTAGSYIKDPQTNEWFLGGLESGTKYYVKVRSENGLYGANSDVYDFKTITLQPSPATNLFATSITDNSFNINWTWGANTSRVRVYYSTDNTDFTSGGYIINSGTNTYALSNLVSGQLYYVKIRSENGIYGVYSTTKTVRTTVTNVSPTPVTNISVNNITETSMELNWSVGSNTDKIKVYWSTNNSTWISSNDLSGTATSYNITGLESATEYYLKVRSENSGQMVFSNTITETTKIIISTADLFSHYPLNETSGDAIDLINGNNLTVNNVVRNGSFYSFNGSTSSAYSNLGIGAHQFFDSNGDIPFTIRMSIRIDAFAQSKYIISRRYSPSDGEWVVTIDDGILKILLYENGDTIRYISRGVDVSGLGKTIFYRIGVRYLGNNLRSGLAIFINGIRSDNINFGSSSYSGMDSTKAKTSLSYYEGSSGYRFAGDMKQLFIDKGGYLSDKEMKADFQQNL